jgi:hypothetical protein
MAKSFFLPNDDAGKADLLEHFAAALPKYAELLEIGAAELASVKADATAFRAALQDHQAAQAYAQQRTVYKNLLRDGGSAEAAPPKPPQLAGVGIASVAPGIFPRFTALANRIKNHRKYTLDIGHDLGIVGSEQVSNSTVWKPVLAIRMNAGRPTIKWTKGKAEALEIQVDRGDGQGFGFLAIDLRPDYDDTAPLPAPGTAALWKYRAIYRVNDAQVGEWSDVISVVVGG